jgi:hypothetical protein
VDIGVLVRVYSSAWSSPSFAIPKKNGTIKVVTDFRKLNLLLKRRASPISYTKDWGYGPFNGRVYLCYCIGLQYRLLYYHIKLDADAQNLCTIVFLWHKGKYKYKCLPMGIKISPDAYQNVMSKFVQDMEYVKTAILS